MAQCDGTTKKGDRCKRESAQGSKFCAIHLDQEVRARNASAKSERSAKSEAEWDSDAVFKTLLGFALVGVIIAFRFKR
jgi:hypothetical protein